ncbi:MAG: hypothetical protein R2729_29035 [Bryobacteraceae bacterium]
MGAFPDDDERFRSPPLDASANAVGPDRRLGQFDRHSLVLWLNPLLSAALDSQGGALPSYSVEPPDSVPQRAFSAHLHETIHYWQTIGSTAGFLHTLGDATSAFSVMDDLIASKHHRKPVLHTVPDDADAADPALLASVRWRHIEYGSALLDDPMRAVALLQRNPRYFVSTGQTQLSLCANTAASLADAFDRDFSGLINPESWADAYERFVGDQHKGFETEGILRIPLGLRDIAEAQARISEIQHRDLTQQAVSWRDVRANGWLGPVYARAFDRFLELAKLDEPETPREDSVNLFLLVCDVALNPSTGYADDLDQSRQFVLDFHPGARFERLCHVVARSPDLLKGHELPSRDGYEAVSRRLCGVLGGRPQRKWLSLFSNAGTRPPRETNLQNSTPAEPMAPSTFTGVF